MIPTVPVQVVDGGALAVAVATLALVVLAASGLVIAYVQYRRHLAEVPEYVRRERLRAYSAVMSEMVALNRLAVELDEDDRFTLEQRKYSMSKDSEIEMSVGDVTETFQRYYHVLDPAVQDAVNDYLDFLATYHADPVRPPVADLLDHSSRVVTTMRRDLDLEHLGPEPPVADDAGDESTATGVGDDTEDPQPGSGASHGD